MDKVTITQGENFSFEAHINSSPFPLILGDSSKNSNYLKAKPLLLVALGGCTAMDIASLIRKMRVAINDFNIEVEAIESNSKPKVYTLFCLCYKFTVDGLPTMETKQKLHKIVEMSQERFCVMSEMVRKIAPIKYSITINGHNIETCACTL